MTIKSKCRGYDVEWVREDNCWYFCDTNLPMLETQADRPCGFCGLDDTIDGHDGCLSTLPGVMNACCGHGRWQDAYIQSMDGSIVDGNEAIKLIENKLKDI
jgi:hypothetical protein